jgi:hypothetical protein
MPPILTEIFVFPQSLEVNAGIVSASIRPLPLPTKSSEFRNSSVIVKTDVIQGDSNMTGTDLCVNKPHKSRSYLNHLVYSR